MKNKGLPFIFVLLFMLKLSAQTVESKAYQVLLKGMLSHSVPEVSVSDVEKEQNVLFIDSREAKEYEVSHIKGAINVGYDTLNLVPLQNIEKNQKIIVYCSIGYRSEKVAEQLLKEGFTDVSNLYGGIFEWKNQNKPIVNLEKEPTEKVHAFNKVWGIWLKKGKKVY